MLRVRKGFQFTACKIHQCMIEPTGMAGAKIPSENNGYMCEVEGCSDSAYFAFVTQAVIEIDPQIKQRPEAEPVTFCRRDRSSRAVFRV